MKKFEFFSNSYKYFYFFCVFSSFTLTLNIYCPHYSMIIKSILIYLEVFDSALCSVYKFIHIHVSTCNIFSVKLENFLIREGSDMLLSHLSSKIYLYSSSLKNIAHAEWAMWPKILLDTVFYILNVSFRVLSLATFLDFSTKYW